MPIRGTLLSIASVLLLIAGRVIADNPPPKKEAPKLVCDLIVKQDIGTAGGAFGGVLLVKNTTKAAYKVTYTDDPTEHLVLEVRDARGKLLPNGAECYGAVYAKLHLMDDEDQELIIKPGETYRYNLALLALVDQSQGKLAPGRYTVQAVFKNNKEEYRSKSYPITIVAK